MIPIIIIPVILLSASVEGKVSKLKSALSRSADYDSSGTLNISVKVGNGSGDNEEIFNQTLLYLPHAEDVYSVYLGFFGVTFNEDSGVVHQSRITSLNGFPIDGELTNIEPMAYLYDSTGFRVGQGIMGDNTIGQPDTVTGQTDSIAVIQRSYIRPTFYDAFVILEYTIINCSDDSMTGGKTIFFCDFDVGDFFGDDYTAVDTVNRAVYQYSLNDDYAGLSLIFPLQPDTIMYGNYSGWYFNGSDEEVDNIVNQPYYHIEFQYDTSYITTGDYSSYIVNSISDIAPDDSVKAAYAFAIGPNFTALQIEMSQAYDLYNGSINSIRRMENPIKYSLMKAYPNPFNSSAVISFDLPYSGETDLIVYDVLGREVQSLVTGQLSLGHHELVWNAKDFTSGIYFAKLKAGDYYQTKKLLLIK